MQNGLYKVVFRTSLGTGGSVVVLREGRLWGGDSTLYFVGVYEVTGAHFKAHLQIDRHTPEITARPLFGPSRLAVEIEGDEAGGEAVMRGTSKEAPGVTFEAVMTRLSD